MHALLPSFLHHSLPFPLPLPHTLLFFLLNLLSLLLPFPLHTFFLTLSSLSSLSFSLPPSRPTSDLTLLSLSYPRPSRLHLRLHHYFSYGSLLTFTIICRK